MNIEIFKKQAKTLAIAAGGETNLDFILAHRVKTIAVKCGSRGTVVQCD